MIEPERGFDIDDGTYRWGALPGDIAGMGLPPSTAGYLHRDLPCRSIFGLAGAGVTVSAPAADRPVMTVTYELAAPWLLHAIPDHWLEAARSRFGVPTSEGNHDLRGYRDPSSGVIRSAHWHRPTIEINVSIYGGTRSVKFGRSAGLISLGWTDTMAAALPFLPAWHAACDKLGQAARSLQVFQRFDMPEALAPAASSIEADSAVLLPARRALYNRTILATPQPIRDRLDQQALALWQSSADGQWAVSSVWDTVPLRDARIGWNEIRPAKGGGHSELSFSGWSVAMPYGTPAIAAAAAALKALPGVVVEAYEGYDA